MQFEPKQINKLIDSNGSSAGFTTTTATSDNVTTEVQAVLGGLGLVELVATTTVAGVLTSDNNRVEIYDNVTKQKVDDGDGNEVYGRMTGTVGAWTLSYYSLVAGVETAFTFDASDIDFDFGIRFEFKDLPMNAIRAVKQKVNDDLSQTGGHLYAESITIAVQNTVPDVTRQPSDTGTFRLVVNGKDEFTFAPTPAVTASTANKTVAWSAANAGYNLDTTDEVVAIYLTEEV